MPTAAADDLSNCSCKSVIRHGAPLPLQDGHVRGEDTQVLRWPYLKSTAKKGRKYRLEAPLEDVFHELDAALEQYVTWAASKDPSPAHSQALERWSTAVKEKCATNMALNLKSKCNNPQG